MRILYITPRINGEGGLVRVISIKANYITEVFGHEVHILTQNNNHLNRFYHFNDKIIIHNSKLSGNRFQFLLQYIKSVKKIISETNPDIVLVCDGFKGFFLPFFLNVKIPIFFETHGSIYNRVNKSSFSVLTYLTSKINVWFKRIAANKFNRFIVLSEESKSEWRVKNSIIIPNPNWLKNVVPSQLNSKKAIAICRHSYEKGIDRLLQVWKKVLEKHPDWVLEIYGSFDDNFYHEMAKKLSIEQGVSFFEPSHKIEEKYQQASLLLMTSRYEGFPMVLIEAMSFGLPCIAFDCPCGPRAIITSDVNGFLIENDAIEKYADKVIEVIENPLVAKKISENAVKKSKEYDIEVIMNKWNMLFNDCVNSKKDA